jgi:hypothetical protein
MVEAVAMASARKLLGEQPNERLRVWYHNGEDPRSEIDRRLYAICRHYGLKQQDIEGHLFVTSGNDFPLRVARGYTTLRSITPWSHRFPQPWGRWLSIWLCSTRS